ncbi:MAG: SpoIIE family protein phosphatase [Microscillaceae bacterium]|nr:SpoIIE family protein phosphatase [Microscillaceae bacterium]
MKILFNIRFFILLLSIQIFSTLNSLAQQNIKGTVIDEANKPVKNVQIKIIHCNITNSGTRGAFTVQPRQEIKNLSFDDVKIVDGSPYLIKEVKFFAESGNLQIVLKPAGKLKGALITEEGQSRANHKIVLLGANENNPSISDTKGAFEIKYPSGIKLGATSRFKVDGQEIAQENVEFQQNNTFVKIHYKPQAIVKTQENKSVLVKNNMGRIIPNTPLTVQRKAYMTDQKGIFIPDNILELDKDSSIFMKDHVLLSKSMGDPSGQITLVFRPLKKDTSNQVQKLNPLSLETEKSIEDDFNQITSGLLGDREEQIRRSKRFESELENLTTRLLSESTFTPEQRQIFKNYITGLESTFKENDSIYSKWHQDARSQLFEMQLTVWEKDSLKSLAEKKVKIVESKNKKLETEKKLAELRFRDNIIILFIIIAVLVILALTFYLYNRVISRQKNELEITKNALSEKVEEINQQNEEIRTQRDNIADKNQQIEKAYQQIRSSIYSAERIQSAILDKPREILRHFEDGFIYFAPRDIVSGDFYWHTQKGGEIIIAAVDCTGHGVPGAFMTMLGNSLLNQLVIENHLTEPSEILEKLDEKVRETLHQQERESGGDGMDMTILNYNKYENKITFAGAKNPLYYIKNQVFHQIKGTNMPVGGSHAKKKHKFESHVIPLEGGEIFYMQSDGYQDQFGGTGEYGKKFMKTQYKNLLSEICHLPMQEQSKILQETLSLWKSKYSQTDDILVIGLKV